MSEDTASSGQCVTENISYRLKLQTKTFEKHKMNLNQTVY